MAYELMQTKHTDASQKYYSLDMIYFFTGELPYGVRVNVALLSDATSPHSVTGQSYHNVKACLLYTSPSPRDRQKSRMPSSA